MTGFILLMRFVSKSYSVKLNDKLTPGVGFGVTKSEKEFTDSGN
jgi:hypothetical protein